MGKLSLFTSPVDKMCLEKYYALGNGFHLGKVLRTCFVLFSVEFFNRQCWIKNKCRDCFLRPHESTEDISCEKWEGKPSIWDTMPMCSRTKGLVCFVPWTIRPLDNKSLGRSVPWLSYPRNALSKGSKNPRRNVQGSVVPHVTQM
jgi:hypothetical protein